MSRLFSHPADAALEVITALRQAGYEAFFVGGTVRDLLLKREPHDLDVVTDARPDVLVTLFPHHVPSGLPFGIVGVITPHGVVDVATYRTEQGYADRRRPTSVQWATLEADVTRRDFTVNGLALDPLTDQVIDLVGGERDLALGLIRTIGSPAERFAEDPLRLLRAIRLRAELNFQYDPATYRALCEAAPLIRHVSAERIRTELDRAWATTRRDVVLTDLDQTGLLSAILPEIAALHGVPQPPQFHREGDVFDHTRRALTALPEATPVPLVWATLLHDVAKPLVLTVAPRAGHLELRTPDHARRSAAIASQIAARLAFSRADRETVSWLIEHHMSLKDIEAMRPAKRERYLLDPRFPLLLELHRADALGTDPVDLSLYEHDRALYERMVAAHAGQTDSPPLLVTGDDLIAAKIATEGPQVATLLEAIRDAQLDGRVTTRDQALSLARSLTAAVDRES